MTRVIVSPGICGFETTVEAEKATNRRVSIKITSDCDQVAKLGESLAEVDAWDALKPREDSEVYRQASRHLLHTACPVPVAILKAIEVEAELALPADVVIHFEVSGHD